MDAGDRLLNRPAEALSFKDHQRIREKRLAPFSGEVNVSYREKVDSSTIIARYPTFSHPLLLPVAKYLSVPEDQLPSYLLRVVGEEVKKGEALAGRRGFLSRIYRSPTAGKIVSLSRGRMILDPSPSTAELLAHLSGTVVELVPNRGAVIETRGALLEGVWGRGGETSGILKMVTEGEIGPLGKELLDSRFSESIVVWKGWATKESLLAAADSGIRGMVLGSLPATLLDAVSSLPYPLMLTEGFGEMPMARPIAQFLGRQTWQEVYLSARSFRPHLITPFEPAEPFVEEEGPAGSLQPGQQVRIIGGKWAWQTGLVVDPTPRWQRLESGLFAWCVEVALEEGKKFAVPLTNLQLLG